MFDANATPPSHALMQDRAFAAALNLCGEAAVILPSGLMLLNRRIGGIPVLMLPRACPPDDLHAQLAQAGLSRRPLLLSPERPCPLPRALPLSPQRMLLSLDLSLPEGDLRARLHQKWRNQLRRAEQSDLRVRHRPLTPDHPVLTLDAAQSRSRRYQNWPVALTSAFARTASAQTHVFTALLRGHAVAHMVFLTHANRATYHIGHTTDQGRATYAHNLLLWNAMKHLAKRGSVSVDLGPATTPDIDRFKRRAGAIAAPTGGTWLRWTPLARLPRP